MPVSALVDAVCIWTPVPEELAASEDQSPPLLWISLCQAKCSEDAAHAAPVQGLAFAAATGMITVTSVSVLDPVPINRALMSIS